jgi:hypothetical protein
MLVKQLYGIKHSKSKESLWFCYGDIIVDNLKRNIGNKTSVCQHCGKRFKKESPDQKYCNDCKGYQKIEYKYIHCLDCDKKVKVDSKDNQTVRCDECYKKWRQERKLETQRIRRKSEMKSAQF